MSASEGRPYDPAKDAAAQEPLTANEQKLVTRLFGDPFAFPMEFKAWLRGWLEEQFPRIGTLSVSAETGAAGSFVPPAGAILEYGGDVAPGGYVLCDGAQYDKTGLAYQRLFTAIGYRFSLGVTTGNLFRVPDLRERVAVMKGALAELDTIGESDNLGLGSRGLRHRHTVSQVGWESQGITAGGDADVVLGYSETGERATHDHDVGVGTPLDGPAFLVVNKIISLGA